MAMEMVVDYRYLPPDLLELIIAACPQCGVGNKLVVNEHEFENWADGKLIQDAFPDMPPAERELLLTAICGNCFRKMREAAEEDEDKEEK